MSHALSLMGGNRNRNGECNCKRGEIRREREGESTPTSARFYALFTRQTDGQTERKRERQRQPTHDAAQNETFHFRSINSFWARGNV